MSPGPEQGLLDEIFGALAIATAQPQRVREESVTVFGMQCTNEIVVLGHSRLSSASASALGAG
jgi:hypothetical protein